MRANERLSCWSSGSLAPWLLVSKDSVEDCEELPGGCDESDQLGLSGCDEAVAEGLEVGVAARGDHGAEEEGGAHVGPAAADEALALPFAGLAGPGGEADEGGDLAAVERSKLGQLGQQCTRD